jgi:hypothetical protein
MEFVAKSANMSVVFAALDRYSKVLSLPGAAYDVQRKIVENSAAIINNVPDRLLMPGKNKDAYECNKGFMQVFLNAWHLFEKDELIQRMFCRAWRWNVERMKIPSEVMFLKAGQKDSFQLMTTAMKNFPANKFIHTNCADTLAFVCELPGASESDVGFQIINSLCIPLLGQFLGKLLEDDALKDEAKIADVHYIQFFCFRMTEMVHQHILESGIFEV